MSRQRLVVFDVDGTLVNSQGDIVAAMNAAFAQAELEAPARDAILSIVGLSLDVAIPRLAPDAPAALHSQMVDWYKESYMRLRGKTPITTSSPLYPHALRVLQDLHLLPDTLLGVATGKSRRGLDKLLEGHDLRQYFVTQQVADHHPSKPDPSMLHAALGDAGVQARDAVMIGDTSFDMDMARAAGMRAIGVSWGYHDRSALGAADMIIDDFRALPDALNTLWEPAS